MKTHLPSSWKLAYRRTQRAWADRRSGLCARFPEKRRGGGHLPVRFSVSQPIMPGENFENKCQNIRLAAAKIEDVVVGPGQVFSFWHLVPNPTPGNGFLPSRNLVNGQLVPGHGGGICQLSGIVYLLALQACLPILERHRHSLDIYKEQERFAPLGADATVVFGRKDLRFENHLDTGFCLRFDFSGNVLTAHFCAAENTQPADVQFFTKEKNGAAEVRAVRAKDGMKEELWVEVYPKL